MSLEEGKDYVIHRRGRLPDPHGETTWVVFRHGPDADLWENGVIYIGLPAQSEEFLRREHPDFERVLHATQAGKESPDEPVVEVRRRAPSAEVGYNTSLRCLRFQHVSLARQFHEWLGQVLELWDEFYDSPSQARTESEGENDGQERETDGAAE